MRTSTAFFLVVFLALLSSRERRHDLHKLVDKAKSELHDWAEHHHHACSQPSKRSSESDETRALRGELSDVEKREAMARKSLRTVERAIRSLEERERAVEKDLKRDPRFAEIYHANLASLRGQIDQLDKERVEIEALREALKSAAVSLQSDIDLASIRDERREVEAFLDRERGSPVDRLAKTGW